MSKNTIHHMHTDQEIGHLIDVKIKKLRKRLVETGMKNGLNHQETLKYSQCLDELIIKSLFFASPKKKRS